MIFFFSLFDKSSFIVLYPFPLDLCLLLEQLYPLFMISLVNLHFKDLILDHVLLYPLVLLREWLLDRHDLGHQGLVVRI